MDRRTFFDQYADDWDARELPDMGARVSRVATLARVKEGDLVLDVGTGTGVMIPVLLNAIGPTGRVIGIELSVGMLRVASQKRFSKNVALLIADAERPPLKKTAFDCVVCNAVFPHFEDKTKTLRALVDLLKPGGRLVVSHPIGRDAVNRIHSSSDVVREDSVPDGDTMVRFLSDAGLHDVILIDEPEFHFATGNR